MLSSLTEDQKLAVGNGVLVGLIVGIVLYSMYDSPLYLAGSVAGGAVLGLGLEKILTPGSTTHLAVTGNW